ncbi:hypothetical protein G5B38_15935 [Pseudohalocynthiibacter aestuariivivens]|uniref:Uncharacterized protein n=1 Tax=Roseovarius pelagicus TaxID=2980108 RepID=A0ABY6DEK4_9RHOB|nr:MULTISPECIES: hypothetical protein [Rhodobacterales]QIE46890.1 hypothetical protein G5B38_15935 [Pseudohalocynthiibacter aestuariivivens]UXX84563.1 hypothetical protein N7U68_07970 [Roseovarius pelagicus]
MPDPKSTRPTSLGIYDKTPQTPITGIEVAAIVLSGLWLVGSAVFFLVLVPRGALGGPGGAFDFLLTMLAVFLPVAMIWVAATAARSTKVMREESRRLQAAIDAIRQAYVVQNQSGTRTPEGASVSRKLDEIAAAQRKTETALATFSTSRQPATPRAAARAVTPPAADGDQVALPLGTSAEEIRPPLSTDDFIRALNFPETVEDKVGFDALRKALKDRPTALLIQAAQDILTLLSQDGIYMDDLRPDMARPEIWRRFGAGARGREIAALGGIRDRSSLALSAARMKKDPIFRDAAHHFLRRFDRMFASFAETASDAEISELSDTRTARAFMLLGRIAGTFD